MVASIVVRQGPQAVQVEMDDNLLPLLEAVVEENSRGSVLVVRWKRGTALVTRAKIGLVIPTLSSMNVSGSGEARVLAFTTPPQAGRSGQRLGGCQLGGLEYRRPGRDDCGRR